MSHEHKSLSIPADREAMIVKACAADEGCISAGDPHIPQEEKAFRMIREALELERSRLNEIRATLLINFGEKSDRNRYGFAIKDDECSTLSLLVEVLTKLTAASATPEKGDGGWISVAERLPDGREDVLAWLPDDSRVVAQYHAASPGIRWYACYGMTPTHWAPLPGFASLAPQSPAADEAKTPEVGT